MGNLSTLTASMSDLSSTFNDEETYNSSPAKHAMESMDTVKNHTCSFPNSSPTTMGGYTYTMVLLG